MVGVLACLCCQPAFAAVSEEEVQAQVDAVGKEAVSGNVLIWFMCAIGFLKVSQKIDSFMASLGWAQAYRQDHRCHHHSALASGPVFNVNLIISQYCVARDEDFESIWLDDLAAILRENKEHLYSYTSVQETREVTTEDPETGEETTTTETWMIYTIRYNGESYLADNVFALTDEQKELASDYASNLSTFLGDGLLQNMTEWTGNSISSLGDVTFTDGVTPVVYYNQLDERYASQPYGTDNIGGYGCGPTSMAIVVSSLTDDTVDSVEMAQWSYENGCWCKSSGSYHALIPAAAEAWGLPVSGCTTAEPQRIVDALSEGKLVVAIMSKGHFTSSGHFIVLRGVKNGQIMVADPASYKRSEQLWDLSIILKEKSRGPKRRHSSESDFPAEFDEVRSYEIREKLRPKKKPQKECPPKRAKKKSKKRHEKAQLPKHPAHIKEQQPTCLNPVADYLPIEKIQNGIIYTKDHRFVKVVEVVPINFILRSAREQRNIIYSFVSYLKISPIKLQIKVLTRRADINRHLDTVRREMAQEDNEQCRLMQEDYLNFVQQVGAREAVTRRFFLIFEYEPWNNTRRSEQEEAIQSLLPCNSWRCGCGAKTFLFSSLHRSKGMNFIEPAPMWAVSLFKSHR